MNSRLRYITAFDGLRGICTVFVMAYHYRGMVVPKLPGDQLPMSVLSGRAAWFGVDVFFILSGFLVTQNLLATRKREHYYRDFFHLPGPADSPGALSRHGVDVLG